MKHDEIFDRLEPPRGGLTTLRARLDERPPFVRRAAPFALAAAALAAIVLFVVTRPRPLDPVASARAHAGTSEVALGLAQMPSGALALEERTTATTALAEVRSGNPDVKFYWVSSTSWRE